MALYPLRSDGPDEVKDTGKWNKHILVGVVGNFNMLVWECRECGKVRTKGKYFENRCPEY